MHSPHTVTDTKITVYPQLHELQHRTECKLNWWTLVRKRYFTANISD